MAQSTTTDGNHKMSFNDSAFSSEDNSHSSCSSDSCICESSFGTADSAVASQNDSAVNPFGSFRHNGPLPYSVFEDSSSFSSSPVSQRTSPISHNSSFEDSTHIYINLLDRSDCSMAKTTRFWSTSCESRPACDGKEDSIYSMGSLLQSDMNTPNSEHHDVESKVNTWLHHSTFSDCSEHILVHTSEATIDSDATTFMHGPVAKRSIAHSLTTPRRRRIAKNLKQFGKFLHGTSAQRFKLKTLAVI